MNSRAARVKSRLLEIFNVLARKSICSKTGFSMDMAVFIFGIFGTSS
jgi:hypothetical protein